MYSLWYAYFAYKNSNVKIGDIPFLRKKAEKSAATTGPAPATPSKPAQQPPAAPVRIPSTPKDIPGRSPPSPAAPIPAPVPAPKPVPEPAQPKKAPVVEPAQPKKAPVPEPASPKKPSAPEPVPPKRQSNRFLAGGPTIGGHLTACIDTALRRTAVDEEAAIESFVRSAGTLETDAEKSELEARVRNLAAQKDAEIIAALDNCMQECAKEAEDIVALHSREAYSKISREIAEASAKLAAERTAAEEASALQARIKEVTNKTAAEEMKALEECVRTHGPLSSKKQAAALENCLKNVAAKKGTEDASAIASLLKEATKKIAAEEDSAKKAKLQQLQKREKEEVAAVEQCVKEVTVKKVAEETEIVERLYKAKAEETLAEADAEVDRCVKAARRFEKPQLREDLEACIKEAARKKVDKDAATAEALLKDAARKIQDVESAALRSCAQIVSERLARETGTALPGTSKDAEAAPVDIPPDAGTAPIDAPKDTGVVSRDTVKDTGIVSDDNLRDDGVTPTDTIQDKSVERPGGLQEPAVITPLRKVTEAAPGDESRDGDMASMVAPEDIRPILEDTPEDGARAETSERRDFSTTDPDIDKVLKDGEEVDKGLESSGELDVIKELRGVAGVEKTEVDADKRGVSLSDADKVSHLEGSVAADHDEMADDAVALYGETIVERSRMASMEPGREIADDGERMSDKIMAAADRAIGEVISVAEKHVAGTTGVAGKQVEETLSATDKAGDQARSGFGGYVDETRRPSEQEADEMMSVAGKPTDEATSVTGKAADETMSMAGKAMDEATSVTGKAADETMSMAGKAMDEATSVTGKAADETMSMAGKAMDEATSVTGKAADETMSVGEKAMDEATSVTGKAADETTSVTERAMDEATSVSGKAMDEATSITEKVMDDVDTSVTEKLVEEATTSVTERLAEEAATSVTEKVVEEAATSVTEKLAEEAATSVTEKVLEEAATSITEKLVEEAATSVTEKVVEEAATSVTEKVVEEAATSVTEKVLEEAATSVSEKAVDKTTSVTRQMVEDSVSVADKMPSGTVADEETVSAVGKHGYDTVSVTGKAVDGTMPEPVRETEEVRDRTSESATRIGETAERTLSEESRQVYELLSERAKTAEEADTERDIRTMEEAEVAPETADQSVRSDSGTLRTHLESGGSEDAASIPTSSSRRPLPDLDCQHDEDMPPEKIAMCEAIARASKLREALRKAHTPEEKKRLEEQAAELERLVAETAAAQEKYKDIDSEVSVGMDIAAGLRDASSKTSSVTEKARLEKEAAEIERNVAEKVAICEAKAEACRLLEAAECAATDDERVCLRRAALDRKRFAERLEACSAERREYEACKAMSEIAALKEAAKVSGTAAERARFEREAAERLKVIPDDTAVRMAQCEAIRLREAAQCARQPEERWCLERAADLKEAEVLSMCVRIPSGPSSKASSSRDVSTRPSIVRQAGRRAPVKKDPLLPKRNVKQPSAVSDSTRRDYSPNRMEPRPISRSFEGLHSSGSEELTKKRLPDSMTRSLSRVQSTLSTTLKGVDSRSVIPPKTFAAKRTLSHTDAFKRTGSRRRMDEVTEKPLSPDQSAKRNIGGAKTAEETSPFSVMKENEDRTAPVFAMKQTHLMTEWLRQEPSKVDGSSVNKDTPSKQPETIKSNVDRDRAHSVAIDVEEISNGRQTVNDHEDSRSGPTEESEVTQEETAHTGSAEARRKDVINFVVSIPQINPLADDAEGPMSTSRAPSRYESAMGITNEELSKYHSGKPSDQNLNLLATMCVPISQTMCVPLSQTMCVPISQTKCVPLSDVLSATGMNKFVCVPAPPGTGRDPKETFLIGHPKDKVDHKSDANKVSKIASIAPDQSNLNLKIDANKNASISELGKAIADSKADQSLRTAFRPPVNDQDGGLATNVASLTFADTMSGLSEEPSEIRRLEEISEKAESGTASLSLPLAASTEKQSNSPEVVAVADSLKNNGTNKSSYVSDRADILSECSDFSLDPQSAPKNIACDDKRAVSLNDEPRQSEKSAKLEKSAYSDNINNRTRSQEIRGETMSEKHKSISDIERSLERERCSAAMDLSSSVKRSVTDKDNDESNLTSASQNITSEAAARKYVSDDAYRASPGEESVGNEAEKHESGLTSTSQMSKSVRRKFAKEESPGEVDRVSSSNISVGNSVDERESDPISASQMTTSEASAEKPSVIKHIQDEEGGAICVTTKEKGRDDRRSDNISVSNTTATEAAPKNYRQDSTSQKRPSRAFSPPKISKVTGSRSTREPSPSKLNHVVPSSERSLSVKETVIRRHECIPGQDFKCQGARSGSPGRTKSPMSRKVESPGKAKPRGKSPSKKISSERSTSATNFHQAGRKPYKDMNISRSDNNLLASREVMSAVEATAQHAAAAAAARDQAFEAAGFAIRAVAFEDLEAAQHAVEVSRAAARVATESAGRAARESVKAVNSAFTSKCGRRASALATASALTAQQDCLAAERFACHARDALRCLEIADSAPEIDKKAATSFQRAARSSVKSAEAAAEASSLLAEASEAANAVDRAVADQSAAAMKEADVCEKAAEDASAAAAKAEIEAERASKAQLEATLAASSSPSSFTAAAAQHSCESADEAQRQASAAAEAASEASKVAQRAKDAAAICVPSTASEIAKTAAKTAATVAAAKTAAALSASECAQAKKIAAQAAAKIASLPGEFENITSEEAKSLAEKVLSASAEADLAAQRAAQKAQFTAEQAAAAKSAWHKAERIGCEDLTAINRYICATAGETTRLAESAAANAKEARDLACEARSAAANICLNLPPKSSSDSIPLIKSASQFSGPARQPPQKKK